MLTIIGCGNPNRSDDGVGIRVAQRLAAYVRDKDLQDVRVFDAGTDGMSVMFQARGAERLDPGSRHPAQERGKRLPIIPGS